MSKCNENFRIGDTVNFHALVGGPATSAGHIITNIHLAPNDFGVDVAWITNKSGCVALAALSMPHADFIVTDTLKPSIDYETFLSYCEKEIKARSWISEKAGQEIIVAFSFTGELIIKLFCFEHKLGGDEV